jgi:hypothetical protein
MLALAACANGDADQWIVGSSEQRKEHAQRLFVDYREPVFAFLKMYLGDFRDPDRRYRIYVSLFDEELDTSLRTRLAAAGVVVEPGWGCERGGGLALADWDGDVEVICIDIPGIQAMGASRYRIPVTHFEKTSVDHAYEADAVVQLRDGEWQVIKLEPG